MNETDEPDGVDAVLAATDDDTDQQEKTGSPEVSKTPEKPASDTPKRKHKYRMPDEFKGHVWADGINTFVDSWDPEEEELAKRGLLGESYVATIVETLGDEIHPAWIAGINTIAICGVIGARIYKEHASRPKDGQEGGLGLASRVR